MSKPTGKKKGFFGRFGLLNPLLASDTYHRKDGSQVEVEFAPFGLLEPTLAGIRVALVKRFVKLGAYDPAAHQFSVDLLNWKETDQLAFQAWQQLNGLGRVHQTLKGMTPAMAAGVTDHTWSIEELVALLDRR